MSVAEAVRLLANIQERQIALAERDERRRADERYAESQARAPQRPLRRFTVASMLEGVPWAASLFQKQVPGDYWTQSAYREATVACPCGVEPVIEAGHLASCVGDGCNRFYLYTGRDVRVWRVPEGVTPEPEGEVPPDS